MYLERCCVNPLLLKLEISSFQAKLNRKMKGEYYDLQLF